MQCWRCRGNHKVNERDKAEEVKLHVGAKSRRAVSNPGGLFRASGPESLILYLKIAHLNLDMVAGLAALCLVIVTTEPYLGTYENSRLELTSRAIHQPLHLLAYLMRHFLTCCSSSLVALHQAVSALRNRASSLAIASQKYTHHSDHFVEPLDLLASVAVAVAISLAKSGRF